MENFKLDFHELLKTLVRFDVKFIVVGGVGAVLQGAPIVTFDLDIVHLRTTENIDRLLKALNSLNARYRGQGERLLYPDQSHLISRGHQLLLTDLGPLDALGMIGSNRDYDALFPHTIELEIGDFNIRVLNLETIIQVKEEVNHPKDQAVLAILKEISRET